MAIKEMLDEHRITITVATAIVVIIFIIVGSFSLATWKTEMTAQHKEFDDRITHIGEKIIDMRDDIDYLKDTANGRDIQLATMDAKLTNIEVMVIDIRQTIKEINK